MKINLFIFGYITFKYVKNILIIKSSFHICFKLRKIFYIISYFIFLIFSIHKENGNIFIFKQIINYFQNY